MRRVLTTMELRSDALGDGRFGAPRGRRRHIGLDLLADPGAHVFAPESGTVRLGYPYSDSREYRIVDVFSESGVRWRLFYVRPVVEGGARVGAGDVLGVAQDIAARYTHPGGPVMRNHVHVQAGVSGRVLLGRHGLPVSETPWIDPGLLFRLAGIGVLGLAGGDE